MSTADNIVKIITTTLQLKNSLAAESPLMGAIPEFDSMAVVLILTTIEEEYGFFVEDDEIEAATFETVGTLVDFVEQKLNA